MISMATGFEQFEREASRRLKNHSSERTARLNTIPQIQNDRFVAHDEKDQPRVRYRFNTAPSGFKTKAKTSVTMTC
jgi:hypothetical protein